MLYYETTPTYTSDTTCSNMNGCAKLHVFIYLIIIALQHQVQDYRIKMIVQK